MALGPKFREEYIELLEGCLILVKKRDDFFAILQKIGKLTTRLQKELDEIDSPLSVERLFDPDTGRIKPAVQSLLKPRTSIWYKVEELAELELEKRYFLAFGWTDEEGANMDVATTIAMYSAVEREIIATFGDIDGENIIYEAKKSVLALEDELDITFFAPEVKKMRLRAALRELFTDNYGYVVFGASQVYQECHTVNFANAKGQAFRFEKVAELHFEGRVYVELEYMEDFFAGQGFAYYLVEHHGKEGARLTRLDNADLEQKLDQYREKYDFR